MARAMAVVAFLLDNGKIPPPKLAAAGYGEHHPIIANEHPEGRTQNRRVDLIVVADFDESEGAGIRPAAESRKSQNHDATRRQHCDVRAGARHEQGSFGAAPLAGRRDRARNRAREERRARGQTFRRARTRIIAPLDSAWTRTKPKESAWSVSSRSSRAPAWGPRCVTCAGSRGASWASWAHRSILAPLSLVGVDLGIDLHPDRRGGTSISSSHRSPRSLWAAIYPKTTFSSGSLALGIHEVSELHDRLLVIFARAGVRAFAFSAVTSLVWLAGCAPYGR